MNDSFLVEPLAAKHDRGSFTCGVPALDRYLQKQAGQDRQRDLASVFVLTEDGTSVAGFYTLSAQAIPAEALPGEIARKLPRLPVPVTLLGRMAVSSAFQRRNLGRLLLFDALERAVAGSRQIASWAVIVDAKEGAREFYLKYTFAPFSSQPDRLFLPLETARRLLGR